MIEQGQGRTQARCDLSMRKAALTRISLKNIATLARVLDVAPHELLKFPLCGTSRAVDPDIGNDEV